MKYLEALIAKSNIHETLISESKGTVAAATADGAPDLGQLNLFKMLGYFSMIGLLRMHCLLGDYYQALKVPSLRAAVTLLLTCLRQPQCAQLSSAQLSSA
jgi:hypothetical protein